MPSANQRVGEYVLKDRIAAGTFGEVWKAHHHVWMDQLVAVKIPTDPQFLRNLQREGVAVHGLQHPNIVRAIGFDPYADPPYLAMEYVPGTSLRPLIEKKSLKPADAVAILKQVLKGLSHAHGKDLVHRDVKPENILVHERAFREGFAAEGVVKVTDFGLGKAAATTAGNMQSMVMSGELSKDEAKDVAGTLEYMAPEQKLGTDVDGRADLYSAGVLLFEMLTGERPAGTDMPSDVNKAVPKHLDDAFRRSYARIEKRFASAEDFIKALEAAPPPIPGGKVPPIPGTIGRGVPPIIPPLKSGTKTCPQCRGTVDGNDNFCMHCGVQVVENVRRCPQCGAYPDATDRHCIFCGQALTPDRVGV